MTTLDTTSPSRPLIISSDTLKGDGDTTSRTPPGQVLTKKWPVLHYGGVPDINIDTWELRVWGLCDNPYTLLYHDLLDLPQVDVKCDIHCVTHWSRLNNVFTGVLTKTLIELASPKPEAKFVLQHANSAPGDDWTTNVPLDEFIDDDCLLC